MPGDKNNTGFINAGDSGNGCPEEEEAFEDLNDENIIKSNIINRDSICHKRVLSDISKNITYLYLFLFKEGDENIQNLLCCYEDGLGYYTDMEYNYQSGNYLRLAARYTARIPVKVGKAIDEKMDDGIYNTGSIMGINVEYEECYEVDSGLSYDEAIKNKNWYTDEMYFKLDI